jgi:hypothetical protein
MAGGIERDSLRERARPPAPTPLRSATQTYALLPAGHPLAAAEIVDPRDPANEHPLVPRREDNHDICDLVRELLTDSGLATPHVDPRAGVSFAAVLQHHRRR